MQGNLRREGDRLWCDVVRLDLLGDDLERLDQAVSVLPARTPKVGSNGPTGPSVGARITGMSACLTRSGAGNRGGPDRGGPRGGDRRALAGRWRGGPGAVPPPLGGRRAGASAAAAQLKAAHTVEELTALGPESRKS